MLYEGLELRDLGLGVVLEHLDVVVFVFLKAHGTQGRIVVQAEVNVLFLVSLAVITIAV